jgi:V8-like Glu-specific endopeptidase
METSDYPFVGVLVERSRACGEAPRVALCTVSLVAPDRVLTAGHCVEPYRARQLSVRFAPLLTAGDSVTRVVVEHTLHPLYSGGASDHDLAILRLESAVEITPVALHSAPLDASFVGQAITLVGFGATPAQTTQKRAGLTLVDSMDEFSFRYLPSPAMTCRGDSGGPALLEVAGSPELVGVTSAGDAACEEYGVDVRVDANFDDFIAGALVGPPPMIPTRLAPAALCEANCVSDEQCPDALICQTDDSGSGRCVFPQGEPGRFEGACGAGADCASGQCVTLPEGCLCYEPCQLPDAGVDAGGVDAGGGHSGGGCAASGGLMNGLPGATGCWLGMLAWGVVRRRRR